MAAGAPSTLTGMLQRTSTARLPCLATDAGGSGARYRSRRSIQVNRSLATDRQRGGAEVSTRPVTALSIVDVISRRVGLASLTVSASLEMRAIGSPCAP